MTGADIGRRLLGHAARYPRAEARDAVKLLYQARFGPGHLVADWQACLARMTDEWALAPRPSAAAFEAIGGGFARAHLGAFTRAQLPLLCRRFVEAAGQSGGDLLGLLSDLEALEHLCRAGSLPYPPEAVAAFGARFAAGILDPPGHSAAFRAAYAPAYRVVAARCAVDFPGLHSAGF